MSDGKSMYQVAKELYVAEECDSAREAIDKAKAAYLKSGNTKGVADCYVLLTEVIMCEVDTLRYLNAFGSSDDIKEALKEADSIIEEELDSFKKAKNVYGEASMLYAVSKLNADKRGPKKKQKALDSAVEAEKLFMEVGNAQMTAESLLMQATVHFRSARMTEALNCAQEALDLVEKTDAKETQAKAWSTIAMCTGNQNDLKGAIEAMRNSFNLYRELGIKKQEAMKLYMLAQWNNARERPRDALSAAKEALALFEELDYGKGWQGGSMKTLALTYLNLGETQKAKELAKMYLIQYTNNKDKRMMALCNEILSVIHRSCGEMFDAMDCAGEAVKISKNLGDEEYEAVCRQSLARAQMGTVRPEDANDMIPVMDNMIASAKLWNKKGNSKREAEAWNVLGELYRTTNQTKGALETSDKALNMFQEKNDSYGQGTALMIQAQSLLDAKQYKDGIAKAREAAALFKEIKDVTMEGAVYGIISQCAKGANDLESAMDAAKKRQGLLSSSPLSKTGACSFQMVADLHIELGEYQKALKLCMEGQERCRRAEDRVSQLRAMITSLTAASQLLGGIAALPKASKDFASTLDKGFRVAKEAKDLAEKLDQAKGAVGYWTAHLLLYAGRSKDALEEAETARATFKEEKDTRSCANVGLLVADIYKQMDNKDEALKAVQESLSMARQLGAKDLEESVSKRLLELSIAGGVDSATIAQLISAQKADDKPQTTQAISPAIVDFLKKPTPDIVRARISQMASDAVGLAQLAADLPLQEAGIDSLAAVSLRNDIAKEFEIQLPASLMFDHPTVEALSAHVASSLT